MAKKPTDMADAGAAETPEAKAKAAARKAARAAAIAEAYAGSGGKSSLAPERVTPIADPAPENPPVLSTEPDALKLRDLLNDALEGRDLKRSDAKQAIEAALTVLGAALADGRPVNLPGLGKLSMKRSKVVNGRRVSELRLRQKLAEPAGTERVAADDEDS
jgi:hypothetical protein